MSDEQKESSVLFSLKELVSLEEDRVNQERQARQQEEARRRREREEAERLAREEEAARAAAEQERLRREEQQRREEQARLEAIRAAEIERQKVEAQQRAQLEALQQQQAHAQQLEMIRQDQSKKKLRLVAYGAAALFVLASAGGIGTYISLGRQADEQRRIAAETARQVEVERQRLNEERQKALAEIASLKKNLDSATDEATRQKLQRQLDDATRRANTPTRGGGPARPSGPGAPAGAAKTGGKCAPGDPLCVE